MKVACIYNMNNSFFSLARYLRDKGIDADVLLGDNESEVPHFHPSADSYDLSYQQFTVNLSWCSVESFAKKKKSEISNDLRSYDFIIGCGLVPAFMHKIGRQLDIFTPFGGDLYLYPFLRFIFSTNPKYHIYNYLFIRYQKKGIRNSCYINTDISFKFYGDSVRKIKPKGKILNYIFPFLYTPVYNPQNITNYYDRSYWYREFKKIRDAHDLVIFHHARHIWKNSPNEVSWKGNDKLVRGFADFIKKNKTLNPCLIMVEYGPDVNETKKLVYELGIEKNVKWFPLMFRKDIMIGINLSDIGTGDFATGSLSGGVNYEVLAMGKPLMHYRKDENYQNNELYPMMNVYSADDITNALLDYIDRPHYYKDMGEEARKWFQHYAIDKPVEEYVRIIKGGQ